MLVSGCIAEPSSFEVARLSDEFESAVIRSEPGRVALSQPGSERILGAGWSFVERKGESGFVWGSGDPSEIVFYLSEVRDLDLKLVLWPFTFPGAPVQVVTPVLNGKPLEALRLAGHSQELLLPLRATGLRTGLNRLALLAASRHRPAEVLGTADDRELAIALESIEVGKPPPRRAEADLEQDLLRIPVGTSLLFELDLPEESSLEILAMAHGGSTEPATLQVVLESQGAVVLRRDVLLPRRTRVTIPLPSLGRSLLHLTSLVGALPSDTLLTLHSARVVSATESAVSSFDFAVPPGRAGLPEATRYSFGPAWGYLDGDEFPDLFISHHYGHERYGLEDLLLRNDRRGSFETSPVTISPRANPRFPRDLHASVWAPFFSTAHNRDDLYVSVGGRRGDPSKRREIEYFLFRNEPDGLINRARELGVQDIMSRGNLLRGRIGIPTDQDRDGRLDLLLTGDRSPFRLLRNTGTGFVDFSQETGVGSIRPGPQDWDGWRASVADLDGDGYEDLIVGTGPRSSLQVFSNIDGARFELEPRWTSSMTDVVSSWARPTGADRFPELFLLPRDVGPETPIRWIENAAGHGGREHRIDSLRVRGRGLQLTGGDFDNDGDEDLVVLTKEALYLLENRGTSWIDVTARAGLREIFNTEQEGLFSCVSIADYDLDGRVDLIATRGEGGPGEGPPPGPILIARNTSEVGNWLRLELRGRASNPLGLGATIRLVHPDGATQYRFVTNAVSGTCQHDSAVHLGLAGSSLVDLAVSWPSGIRSVHPQVAANRLITIEEPVEGEPR